MSYIQASRTIQGDMKEIQRAWRVDWHQRRQTNIAEIV